MIDYSIDDRVIQIYLNLNILLVQLQSRRFLAQFLNTEIKYKYCIFIEWSLILVCIKIDVLLVTLLRTYDDYQYALA